MKLHTIRQYATYAGWKAACLKTANDNQTTVVFDGDSEICDARIAWIGNVRFYAVWDGMAGTIEIHRMG